MSAFDNTYKGIAGGHSSKIFDRYLQFLSAEANAATVISDVLDIGTGLIDCDMVVMATASSGPAAKKITVEVATDAAFTTPVIWDTIDVPADFVGKWILPFRNTKDESLPYAYVRLQVMAAAANSINVTAFLTKK